MVVNYRAGQCEARTLLLGDNPTQGYDAEFESCCRHVQNQTSLQVKQQFASGLVSKTRAKVVRLGTIAIELNTQRNEDVIDNQPLQQAKDYAIKAEGVINHNSLNRDDVKT